MNQYLVLKAFHILAVVAFLGNISTDLFWMRFARKTGDRAILLHTVSGVITSDKFFTLPGVLIITGFGIATALAGGLPLLRTGWIFWPLVLFSLSGIFFAGWVAPLQKRMKKMLRPPAEGTDNFTLGMFDQTLRRWEFWGFMALLTPVISFFMMILKWPAVSPLGN